MLNFEYYNPTRIIFGKNQLGRLPELLNDLRVNRILLTYGGGSIKKSGLYDEIMHELRSFSVIPFGGIEANPEFSTLMKAVELARAESIDFILAVGGGSVIDGSKFISGAIGYPGDPWDVLDKKEGCNFGVAVPFGSVLTLPATGSEANSGAVVSRSEMEQKRAMGGPQFFPKFSFCDPSQVATLPERQIANGIVDAYMHTLEQYLTYPTGNFLQERQARGDQGKNWLFFGEQHAASDFYYQDEIQQFQKHGVLNELSLAFSRDQPQKIYVQDRMRERGAELWDWLEQGAYFCVCGDASRMAKDVDQALRDIIQQYGKFDEAETVNYIRKLNMDKRYLRDVY